MLRDGLTFDIRFPLLCLLLPEPEMPRSPVQAPLFPPIGPYSHAVVAGGQVFISGTPGVDPETGQMAGDDAYRQSRQILKNFQAMLEAAGGTLDDIVNIQVNLVNVDDFHEMNRAYAEFFTEPYPARAVVAVAALPKQGALMTMSAIAVLRA
ncbi:RidA family protein [Thauera sp.]|uniref:RidA family protein n=1 Tax=Thauera sp. TaxID=1905334 RepID=UPI0039E44BE0